MTPATAGDEHNKLMHECHIWQQNDPPKRRQHNQTHQFECQWHLMWRQLPGHSRNVASIQNVKCRLDVPWGNQSQLVIGDKEQTI